METWLQWLGQCTVVCVAPSVKCVVWAEYKCCSRSSIPDPCNQILPVITAGNRDKFQIWFRTHLTQYCAIRNKNPNDYWFPVSLFPSSHHNCFCANFIIINFQVLVLWILQVSTLMQHLCNLLLTGKMSSYLVVYLCYRISYYTSNGPEKAIKSFWCNELSSNFEPLNIIIL